MVSFGFRGLPNHATMKVNTNDPEVQHFMVNLPENPIPNDEEICLTGGPIGWTIHGVALYNPFNALGTNAVEGDNAEIFDECQGHADLRGVYHYHQLPDNCVFPNVDISVHGIARDGFPIYGPYKEEGSEVQESDLDKCHGRCGVDGKYRYHMTKTYPYIMGCFRGTPVEYTMNMNSEDGDGGERPPPPEGGTQPPQPEGGTRPPRPGGGERPPPGGGPPGGGPPGTGAGSPNQCAYNTVTGSNYEFQTCSAYAGNDGGNGSVRSQITSMLVFTACMITWLFKLIP